MCNRKNLTGKKKGTFTTLDITQSLNIMYVLLVLETYYQVGLLLQCMLIILHTSQTSDEHIPQTSSDKNRTYDLFLARIKTELF